MLGHDRGEKQALHVHTPVPPPEYKFRSHATQDHEATRRESVRGGMVLVVPVLLICIGALLRPLNKQTGKVLILISVVLLILQSLTVVCFCVILWMH